MEHTYIAIDLKSFYASVECAERHLDPLRVNLVVADASRTEKTICLAVSPSLKAYGIPGRARLFEVVQKVKEINAKRLADAVKDGIASAEKLNEAVMNMLELIDYLDEKKKLYKPEYKNAAELKERTDKAAYKAASEGIVLLKNAAV